MGGQVAPGRIRHGLRGGFGRFGDLVRRGGVDGGEDAAGRRVDRVDGLARTAPPLARDQDLGGELQHGWTSGRGGKGVDSGCGQARWVTATGLPKC